MNIRLVLVLAAVLTYAVDVRAQDLTISNARIIVGNGQVIEQGSIVVRNGRIASARGQRPGTPARGRSTRAA